MENKTEPARWQEYKRFSKKEFDCRHTGKNEMKHFFMAKLDVLAQKCGFAIVITSGYRDKTHPEEASKDALATGAHSEGLAADIQCSHKNAFKVLQVALELGFTGIGLQQRGSGRYIHLDCSNEIEGRPRPHVWTY